MLDREEIEAHFARGVSELVGCREFVAVESGQASRDEYDRLIANIIRSHLRSPQLVAFLFALAPPGAQDNVEANLLEELGQGSEGEPSHPALLIRLAAAADLNVESIDDLSASDLRNIVVEPLLFATLREAGLSALVQVSAFEWMLSRTAGGLGRALSTHRGLSDEALEWFALHSEVDIRHAEEALDNILEYVRAYDFDDEEARTLIEIALRENLFIKRYFGELALARVRLGPSP